MRSNNDNLATWRKYKEKLTHKLLEKSILELEKIQANINQKNVSEMMKKLASEEDIKYKASITASAISKNKVLKTIIHEAQAKQKVKNSNSSTYILDAEKQYDIFKLKTIIAKKDAKLKEYENIFQRANLTKDKEYLIELPTNTYKPFLEDLIRMSIIEGFLYIDKTSQNLLHEDDGRIVIQKDILKTLKY